MTFGASAIPRTQYPCRCARSRRSHRGEREGEACPKRRERLGGGLPAVLIDVQLGICQRFNGVLPPSGGHAVVSAGQIRLGNLEIKNGLAFGLVLGVNDLLGFVAVGGMEAGAFAGVLVHAIEHAAPDAPVD